MSPEFQLNSAPSSAPLNEAMNDIMDINAFSQQTSMELSKQYEMESADSMDWSDGEEEEEREVKVKAPPPAELKGIIMQQKASGAWQLGDVGGMLGKLDAGKIKGGIPKLEGSVSSDIETLWVTAVVAAYLQIVFPGEVTNWTQVVNKAHRYITKQKKALGVKPEIDWKQEAEKFVNANR